MVKFFIFSFILFLLLVFKCKTILLWLWMIAMWIIVSISSWIVFNIIKNMTNELFETEKPKAKQRNSRA